LHSAQPEEKIPLDPLTARLTAIVCALYAVGIVTAILFHRPCLVTLRGFW
jgi:hypothetical protein